MHNFANQTYGRVSSSLMSAYGMCKATMSNFPCPRMARIKQKWMLIWKRNFKKWICKCRKNEHWVPTSSYVFPRIWFSSQHSYPQTCLLPWKIWKRWAQYISFVTAHIQEPRLVVNRIVSLLVFLCFFVDGHKVGFDKFLLQLLEQHAIICSFQWSHVQYLCYLKMYTKESSWKLFKVSQHNDRLCESHQHNGKLCESDQHKGRLCESN